jgi:hypothetical protein
VSQIAEPKVGGSNPPSATINASRNAVAFPLTEVSGTPIQYLTEELSTLSLTRRSEIIGDFQELTD